jgi:hypothetical protein
MARPFNQTSEEVTLPGDAMPAKNCFRLNNVK